MNFKIEFIVKECITCYLTPNNKLFSIYIEF